MDSPVLRGSDKTILDEIFARLTATMASERNAAGLRLRRFATAEVRRALDEADAQVRDLFAHSGCIRGAFVAHPVLATRDNTASDSALERQHSTAQNRREH